MVKEVEQEDCYRESNEMGHSGEGRDSIRPDFRVKAPLSLVGRDNDAPSNWEIF